MFKSFPCTLKTENTAKFNMLLIISAVMVKTYLVKHVAKFFLFYIYYKSSVLFNSGIIALTRLLFAELLTR